MLNSRDYNVLLLALAAVAITTLFNFWEGNVTIHPFIFNPEKEADQQGHVFLACVHIMALLYIKGLFISRPLIRFELNFLFYLELFTFADYMLRGGVDFSPNYKHFDANTVKIVGYVCVIFWRFYKERLKKIINYVKHSIIK